MRAIEFRDRYNARRPNWAWRPEAGGDPLTPMQVYAEGSKTQLSAWQTWAQQAKARLDQMMLEDAA